MKPFGTETDYEPRRQNHFGERRNRKTRGRSLEIFNERWLARSRVDQKSQWSNCAGTFQERGGSRSGRHGRHGKFEERDAWRLRSLQCAGFLDDRSQGRGTAGKEYGGCGALGRRGAFSLFISRRSG